MSRGRAHKGLRGLSSRQALRTSLPSIKSYRLDGLEISQGAKERNINLKMSDDLRKKLHQSLDYFINNVATLIDLTDNIHYLSEIDSANIIGQAPFIGWLGETLWRAKDCHEMPNYELMIKFREHFCAETIRIAQLAQKRSEGNGLDNFELQTLFENSSDSIKAMKLDITALLAPSAPALNEQRGNYLNRVLTQVVRVNGAIERVEKNNFHGSFQDNTPNLGWQALAYGEKLMWNNHSLCTAAISMKRNDEDPINNSLIAFVDGLYRLHDLLEQENNQPVACAQFCSDYKQIIGPLSKRLLFILSD